MKQRAMKQSKEQLTENIEPKCKRCRDLGYVFVEENLENYGYHEYAKVCPCCQAGNPGDQRMRAGIPRKFFAVNFPDFRFDTYRADIDNVKKLSSSFFRDFEKWEAETLGLYLWSNIRGSGKTMLASALANSLMIKCGISARFVTVPDYLEYLKRSFSRKPEEIDHTRQYMDCDLLILDDLGAEKEGSWQNQELFRLIDYRYTHRKLVMVTANRPVDKLQCDARIVDRLYDMTVMLHLPEESIRARNADERKQKFIGSII